MVKLVHRSGLVACLALAALVGACGDDDDGGNNNGVDAPPGSGSPDASAAQTFGFSLTKGAEKPTVCATAGANAGGTASVMLNAAGTEITVMANFNGLSAAATMGHIHYGGEDDAGPPVLFFDTPVTTPINKTFTASDYTQGTGAPATFAAFVTELRAGKAYINIHTSSCHAGEIRGQIK